MEGPYEGATCEVQDIASDAVRQTAVAYAAAFFAAEGWPAEFAALSKLYDWFVAEAQPTWEIADHHGVIPPTGRGMMRLPIALALGFVDQWIEPLPSAADEMIPAGPFRDEINRELRALKVAS